MKKSRLLHCFILIFFGGFFMSSCISEDAFTGTSSLRFSQDTVFFDTLFTRSSGTTYPISVTKIVSVKNPENAWVKANFRLGGGNQSPYKLNIDGVSGKTITDLEIGPNDSVFVFIQCSLEANNVLNPALVQDSLLGTVGKQTSKLQLYAYGWDAHYFHDTGSMNPWVVPSGTKWTDKNKPYVIVGNAVVPYNSTFTIESGVQVFASARTYIYVGGQFTINGTASERVIIRGDKPGFTASVLPNQWGGIYFVPKGTGKFSYTDITNANFGIRIDSMSNGTNPSLTLAQTKIQYCGQANLIGVTSNIKATNCLFGDAGTYSFLAYLGGDYLFNHCTFVTYAGYVSRQQGHFALTNTQRDGNGVLLDHKPLSFILNNSIVDGNLKDEIAIDKVTLSAFTVTSSNNLLKTLDPEKLFSNGSNYLNKKVGFKDIQYGNYMIDSTSAGIGKGTIGSPINTVDILGRNRKIPPDIGAYEK